MTGKELLIELGNIDEAFYHEAERRGRVWRKPLLIAAVVAVLLLLAGCGYAVLSGSAWFQAYFAREQKQPLGQGQMDLIANSTKEMEDGFSPVIPLGQVCQMEDIGNACLKGHGIRARSLIHANKNRHFLSHRVIENPGAGAKGACVRGRGAFGEEGSLQPVSPRHFSDT